MKKAKFQKPTGMHDIIFGDQRYFRSIINIAENIFNYYGFSRIDTPLLEDEDLFLKGVGEATDISEKEMYTLKTKGGDRLALRPEGTASVVRSYIEQGMANRPQPVKLYYVGPFFRYERPQAGRYRQFWQFGLESLGDASPVIDAQVINVLYAILMDLKLKNISIEINSIGDKECRNSYKKMLVKYLKSKSSSLCSDCKRRTKDNPLRFFDCKDPKCQAVKAEAPKIIDNLCEDCHAHFKQTLEYLDELELPYQINPCLVRGLDYYTKTVFEFFVNTKEEKSLALGGGGRYDYLVKLLGGKETPAIGAAFGIERIMQAMKDINLVDGFKPKDRVFLAQIGSLAKSKSLVLMESLRKAKIPVVESLGKDSLKIQMAKASRIGSKFIIIIGQKEAIENLAIIKNMETGRQETVPLDQVVAKIKKG